MKNNRFKRNSFGRGGCYTCKGCGKKTRETGKEESSVGFCASCLQESYDENFCADHCDQDGLHHPDCRIAPPHLRTIQEGSAQ